MAEESKRNFYVRNVSEDLVDMHLLKCMLEARMCTCARCQADVRAYALNNFPPHYVVTDLGDMLVRASVLSSQFQADIITAIMKGSMIVKERPKHDKYDIR